MGNDTSKGLDLDRLYSLKEAAPFLDVTEQTVAGYLRSKAMEGKQVGPRKKWHVSGREILRKRKEWGYE